MPGDLSGTDSYCSKKASYYLRFLLRYFLSSVDFGVLTSRLANVGFLNSSAAYCAGCFSLTIFSLVSVLSSISDSTIDFITKLGC